MAGRRLSEILQGVVLILATSAVTLAFDPQPLQDFAVVNKTAAQVVSSDFLSKLLRNAPTVAPGDGAAAIGLSLANFPALQFQGVSLTSLTFLPCGQNPPHVHPRATELVYVLEGRLLCLFADTQNRLFWNILEKGDVTIFPRGLVHAVVNVGKTPARSLAFFNSQNPGTTRVGNAVFTSKDANGKTWPDAAIASAFNIPVADVAKVRAGFPPLPPSFPLGKAPNGCENGRFNL
jgi:oxalate decarboxylase/phosphoglucose isomerase-like protein (cupin superfamily)